MSILHALEWSRFRLHTVLANYSLVSKRESGQLNTRISTELKNPRGLQKLPQLPVKQISDALNVLRASLGCPENKSRWHLKQIRTKFGRRESWGDCGPARSAKMMRPCLCTGSPPFAPPVHDSLWMSIVSRACERLERASRSAASRPTVLVCRFRMPAESRHNRIAAGRYWKTRKRQNTLCTSICIPYARYLPSSRTAIKSLKVSQVKRSAFST